MVNSSERCTCTCTCGTVSDDPVSSPRRVWIWCSAHFLEWFWTIWWSLSPRVAMILIIQFVESTSCRRRRRSVHRCIAASAALGLPSLRGPWFPLGGLLCVTALFPFSKSGCSDRSQVLKYRHLPAKPPAQPLGAKNNYSCQPPLDDVWFCCVLLLDTVYAIISTQRYHSAAMMIDGVDF